MVRGCRDRHESLRLIVTKKCALCGEFSWLFCTKVFRIHLIRRVTAADAGSRHVSESFACLLRQVAIRRRFPPAASPNRVRCLCKQPD